VHAAGIKSEGVEALVCIDGLCGLGDVVCGLSRVGCMGRLGWVGGGVIVERGSRGDWVRLVYSGVGYAIVGCGVEAMYGWRWDLRFVLEYVELVGAWLFPSIALFTAPAGWADC